MIHEYSWIPISSSTTKLSHNICDYQGVREWLTMPQCRPQGDSCVILFLWHRKLISSNQVWHKFSISHICTCMYCTGSPIAFMGSQMFRVTHQLKAVVDNRRESFKAPPSRGAQRGSPFKVIYLRFQNLLLSKLTPEAYMAVFYWISYTIYAVVW